MRDSDKQARRNAFLYCKFRDEQFALYDAFAKEKGMTMNTLLVVNALFYAKDGLTQSEICATVHHSKQTVSLIVKKLLAEGRAETVGRKDDKRAKVVRLTDAGRAWAEGPVRHITTSEDAAMAMLTPEEQAKLVIKALIEGDDDNLKIRRTIPDIRGCMSVKVKGEIAYVDIKRKMIENHSEGRDIELLTVYSIVNSLASVKGITNVRFTIEGEVSEDFMGYLDMRETFIPDYTV